MQKEKNRNLVFILSVCLTLLICLWSILLPDSFGTAAGNSMRFLTTNFAWLYCLAMTLFVAFCLWIGLFSRYRNIPLGPDGAKPEYSKSAWFSMLFCAGMGVGLVFWGAAPARPCVLPLPALFFIGAFTPGSIIPCWRWHWPICSSAKGSRGSSVPCFSPSSGKKSPRLVGKNGGCALRLCYGRRGSHFFGAGDPAA